MTLIFIMTSDVTAQGHATKKYVRGLLKKDKVKVDFSMFFRHLKASGVLPVCDSGLILRTYNVTVLAYTNKSQLIESVNK